MGLFSAFHGEEKDHLTYDSIVERFFLTRSTHFIQYPLGSGVLFGCVTRAYRLDLRPSRLGLSCGTALVSDLETKSDFSFRKGTVRRFCESEVH